MHFRVSLALILVTGCAPADTDTDASDGAPETGTAQAAGTTDAAADDGADAEPGPTGADAGDTTTGTTSGSSQSAAGSDASSSPTTGVEGSGTGDTGDTSDTGDTGGCVTTGPAPVELGAQDDPGAPGAYVALAKSAITNVPGTTLDGGHVGISPAAESAIVGFALALDPSGVYSTSPALAAPWRVYAADHAVPTPIDLTTAVLAMQAAYTDAAGRVPTDHLDLASGDLGGLTLEPGVYTWGSTVLVPDDVTLAGCADDVWIFQIANDLDVSTGKRVLLSGGAQARNVFWQVAGQATFHANAHVEGVILSKTGITFQTGASMHGRALAQTMIAFDANAVTAPGLP